MSALPPKIARVARRLLSGGAIREEPLNTRYSGEVQSVLQCCIAYNAYGGYCVPLSSRHRPAAQKVLSGKVYEPATIEYISKHSADGDIVHAGTYFGDFLPGLSRTCSEGARIWAFEPNPESYRCACVTILVNSLDNIEITNAGLGATDRRLLLEVADESGRALGGGSRITEGQSRAKKNTVEVDVVTLDDVVPKGRTIDILHLDVEGFEQPALDGGIETIMRCRPILILESTPSKEWVSANILSLGYREVDRVHANTVFAAQ